VQDTEEARQIGTDVILIEDEFFALATCASTFGR
jgi:hypothetical protein